MVRSNPHRAGKPETTKITTILHHPKTHLIHGSRTGPSIVAGTMFNQFSWYQEQGLVRNVVFRTETSHTVALFRAYEDLLGELYPDATSDDICWDYLKLDVPNKRSVERVLKDGNWTPREILKDLPKRSMRMFLRCRYIAADTDPHPDSEPSASETEEDESSSSEREGDESMASDDLQQTPPPKIRAGSNFAIEPESPQSDDELSVGVNTAMGRLRLETPPMSPAASSGQSSPASPPTPPPARRANDPKKRRTLSQQLPPRAQRKVRESQRSSSNQMPSKPPALPEPIAVENAMFKVTIRGLFHSAVRVIVGPVQYDDLCKSIRSAGGFAEAVETLLNCELGQARVAEIAVTRRNAPQIAFTSQLEMGFVLGSLPRAEVEQYAGMNVYAVEARLEKCA